MLCYESTIESAVRYRLSWDWSVFPLQYNSKRPAAGFSWLPFQATRPTLGDIRNWSHGSNLALATGRLSGVVVVDCESLEDARWFCMYRANTPLRVRTPRGMHLYFAHPGQEIPNAQKIPDPDGTPRYDIRGDGGYVLLPPSQIDGRQYAWDTLPESRDVPVFRPEWRWPEYLPTTQTPAPAPQAREVIGVNAKIKDGAKYISHIRAISGQAGHNETFRAVCALRDSGMTPDEALIVLQQWNETNASPPWSERELIHKVNSVFGDRK